MLATRFRVALLTCSLAAACADVLSLHDPVPIPEVCFSEADCPPKFDCKAGSCVAVSCREGQHQCEGRNLLTCGPANTWTLETTCEAYCAEDACAWPPSCVDQHPTCGDEHASCCETIFLPQNNAAAHFEMRYALPVSTGGVDAEDQPHVTRTIRPFTLDRFEVTARRFAAFIIDYDHDTLSVPNSGAHPAFPDSGWKTSWSDQLPTAADALGHMLTNQNVQLDAYDAPIRGVSWYVAMAFCIWDGGRLPTEAEWAYAAVGGENDFLYPWGSPRDNPIDHDRAVYSDDSEQQDGPAAVGTHPTGRGAFGHEDLAGNVKEWVFDSYKEMPPATCKSSDTASAALDDHECLEAQDSEDRVLRGGCYGDSATELRNVERSHSAADIKLPLYGFRCARDVPLR